MLPYITKTSYLYYIKSIKTMTIKGHLIQADTVNKRHPHIAKFKPTKYMLMNEDGTRADKLEYYEINDIMPLLSAMEMRTLLSEVVSFMPFAKPLEILSNSNEVNYEVMFNFCTYKPGDIVTESELVAKMNMANKPEGGSKPMSYFKSKFPTMIGNDGTAILRETNKPRRINFHG